MIVRGNPKTKSQKADFNIQALRFRQVVTCWGCTEGQASKALDKCRRSVGRNQRGSKENIDQLEEPHTLRRLRCQTARSTGRQIYRGTPTHQQGCQRLCRYHGTVHNLGCSVSACRHRKILACPSKHLVLHVRGRHATDGRLSFAAMT